MNALPGKLILARHHESEWNKLGKWTGLEDRHLTAYGFEKSAAMGELIKDMRIDKAFASMQVRSIETLTCILNTCELHEVPTEHSASLNERDYGDYTGKNKWEVEKLIGEDEFRKLRRGWDYPIPHGESLKDVYARTIPYFIDHIVPSVRDGKNTLVVAHGNSLRSILKYIESISDEKISDVEFPFGTVIIFDIDAEGHMVHKEIRTVPQTDESVSLQVVATLGPASHTKVTIDQMIRAGVDAFRLPFTDATMAETKELTDEIHGIAQEARREFPIILDISGKLSDDQNALHFAQEENLSYVAISNVADAATVTAYKEATHGGVNIIAKIEQPEAVQKIDEIIAAADGIMLLRSDLDKALPVEQIPFIQRDIVTKCNNAGKPVIVATQLLNDITSSTPEDAEVTDIVDAVLEGADAVMLTDETANGRYPVEASAMMERIVGEAKKHLSRAIPAHSL